MHLPKTLLKGKGRFQRERVWGSTLLCSVSVPYFMLSWVAPEQAFSAICIAVTLLGIGLGYGFELHSRRLAFPGMLLASISFSLMLRDGRLTPGHPLWEQIVMFACIAAIVARQGWRLARLETRRTRLAAHRD